MSSEEASEPNSIADNGRNETERTCQHSFHTGLALSALNRGSKPAQRKNPPTGLSLFSIIFCLSLWIHGILIGLMKTSSALPKFIFAFAVPMAVAGIGWKSAVARRVAASLLYFLWTLFAMCLANSVAWFRNPKFAFSLPDVLHEFVEPLDFIQIPVFGLRNDSDPVQGWSPLIVSGTASIETANVIDAILGILSASTLVFVISRPYRWLILRRFLVIYGSLALLRAFTVFSTQLPDSAARCREITPSAQTLSKIDYYSVVERAMDLVIPIEPLTCGDMVFSGHTMMMMLHGLTWHTYYKVVPGTLAINRVKVVVWLLIFTGMILIVLSRMHYTLDVLLAAYLALTVWNAYHRCADDVIIGHRFHSVWLLDGLLIYPFIQWLEAPHLGEARKGMIQNLADLKAYRKWNSALVHTTTSRVPSMTAAGHLFAKFRLVVDFRALVRVFQPQTLVANLTQFVAGSLSMDSSSTDANTISSSTGFQPTDDSSIRCGRSPVEQETGQHMSSVVSGSSFKVRSLSKAAVDTDCCIKGTCLPRDMGTGGTLRVRATLGASGADFVEHLHDRAVEGNLHRTNPKKWWNPTLYSMSQMLQGLEDHTSSV